LPRERQTRLCACFFISSELSYHRCAFDAIEATGSIRLANIRQPGCSSWKVRDPFRQSSVAHAPTPIPDVSTMVEKIDFTKSGATDEARQYAETITLEMCKHTAKACGFITTGDTDPVNVSDSDAVVRRRKKQTDLNQFFFTLGVASLSGLRRRFYSEKLPEPFPGLTPLLHDRVSAILALPRAEFVSVRHDHDHVRFSSRRRGSRRLTSASFHPHARLANHGREDRLHEERRDGRGAGVRRDHHPGDVQAHRPGVRLRREGRGPLPKQRQVDGQAHRPTSVLLHPRRVISDWF